MPRGLTRAKTVLRKTARIEPAAIGQIAAAPKEPVTDGLMDESASGEWETRKDGLRMVSIAKTARTRESRQVFEQPHGTARRPIRSLL